MEQGKKEIMVFLYVRKNVMYVETYGYTSEIPKEHRQQEVIAL